MACSHGDVAHWLLALDADNLDDGLTRVNALIATCDTAIDALAHLPVDLEWTPDTTLQSKARTAKRLVTEVRDELKAARRRLGGW